MKALVKHLLEHFGKIVRHSFKYTSEHKVATYLFYSKLQTEAAVYFTKYLSVFSPNAGKCGPEKTPYLDKFHAVNLNLE